MNIKRRDFIRAGGMLAIAGGGAAVAAARAGKRTILVEHCGYPGGVGAVPYAGLRKRLEGQNHFFA